ncbi:uncharacterized protein LOC115883515 [Sitophilus oryzae]|uniref:Uncharacterized protein LOC115883515 n=1 Tax=Sitophilus oryzae TaxID=7048 RepID=A0A6J2Y477_SITOR|nr:uncharacterized protein LOC115883515 [Sitophilus oryzae]
MKRICAHFFSFSPQLLFKQNSVQFNTSVSSVSHNQTKPTMASTPTTIVVLTQDKVNFPMKYAYVVMNQLFQYGVKEITQKDDKIFISLTYTPRATTLKKKFGNLPIRYMRTRVQNTEDIKILEKVVKRYKFNLIDEDREDTEQRQQIIQKRKLQITDVYTSGEEEEEGN